MTVVGPDAPPTTADRRPPVLVPILLGGVVVTWGSAFTGIKVVLREVGPGGLTFGRLAIAALTYTALLPVVRGTWPERRPGDVPRLVLLGLTGSAAYHLALNWGEQFISAGVASLVIAAMPAMVAVLAAAVLHEPLGVRRAAGVGVAFAGVAVLALAGSGRLEVDSLVGTLVTMVSPVVWAVYTVVSKSLADRYDGVRLNLVGAWVGAAVVLPFGAGSLADLRSMSGEGWAWLVFLGAVSTAGAYVVYGFALRHWHASAVATFVYLVPLASMGWAWLLLDEVPSAWAVVGGALIIGGVVLVQRAGRRARRSGGRQPRRHAVR